MHGCIELVNRALYGDKMTEGKSILNACVVPSRCAGFVR